MVLPAARLLKGGLAALLGVATLSGALFIVQGRSSGAEVAAFSGPHAASATSNSGQNGYWLAGSDGGVFAFGNAKFDGSCPGIGGCSTGVSSVMTDGSGNGYWVVTYTGNVYAFGDATNYGDPATYLPYATQVPSAVRTSAGTATGFSSLTARCTPMGTPPIWAARLARFSFPILHLRSSPPQTAADTGW